MYFSEPRAHAVSLFISSNILPLQILYAEKVSSAVSCLNIRDIKIVDYGWLRRLGMCHATKISMRCHRRASETVCFPAISRCGEDGKNHSR